MTDTTFPAAAAAADDRSPAPLPKSAAGIWTGIAGIVAAITAIVLLRDWLQPSWMKTLAVLGAGAAAMILVDVAVYRTYLNPTTGLAQAPLRPFDPWRFAQKLVGLSATISVVALAYASLPEYAGDYYRPFKQAALWCLPALIVFSPLYVAYVDRRQREPDDAYVQLAMLIGGRRPDDWSVLAAHARGWLVKAFFLPLMFVLLTNNLLFMWSTPLPAIGDFGAIFAWTIAGLYLVDVFIAGISYALTLRLLDTHIRSVEPTLGGWVICLICYAPFSAVTLDLYLRYDQDKLAWGDVFGPYPLLYVVWGLAILALIGIYTLSTVVFGLRFSNLTNRGIITNGPYRWTKHPAYLAKNLSWWMISVPFIAGAGWPTAILSCLLLGGLNLVYLVRARTEERHLAQDPVYRDYQAYMAEHGLLETLLRKLRGPQRRGPAYRPTERVEPARRGRTAVAGLSAPAPVRSAPVEPLRWGAPQLWLLAAAAAVAALYVGHTFAASRMIDGVRWFWLDDDMMISMRYARNLAESHGLVFNPGELVEGYTNFGWVTIMAAVHLLPLTDQLMPVALRAVSALICVGAIVVAACLLQRLEPWHLALTLPVVLLLIVSCTDVMFWAVSGFETILITALHLVVVLLAVSRRRIDAWLLIPLALLPIIRSDGMVIWMGDALLVFWLARDRKQAGLLLLTTLAPFAAHLLFRLAYYGELMPNTYYLKVSGLDDSGARGFDYVRRFAERYGLILVMAFGAAASLWRRNPAAISLLTSFAPAFVYAWYVGGDSFHSFRFFAHVMPELFIWATIGAVSLARTRIARAVWVLVPIVVVALPRLANPLGEIVPVSGNGGPFDEVVVAAQLLKNASPEASVAVIPAGIVPYFTRLHTVDLLGKTDPFIARLRPWPGSMLGHGKIDPAYSFAKQPDYVASVRPKAFADDLSPLAGRTHDYVRAILASPEFQENWKPQPIPDPYLLERSAVYVGARSPELDRLATWEGVVLGP